MAACQPIGSCSDRPSWTYGVAALRYFVSPVTADTLRETRRQQVSAMGIGGVALLSVGGDIGAHQPLGGGAEVALIGGDLRRVLSCGHRVSDGRVLLKHQGGARRRFDEKRGAVKRIAGAGKRTVGELMGKSPVQDAQSLLYDRRIFVGYSGLYQVHAASLLFDIPC